MSDRTQLSVAQKKMLLAAAKRYGRTTRSGEEIHFVFVGQGQASTAKSLEALGLGGYTHDRGSGAKFWIWDKGYEMARDIEAEREVRRDELKAHNA